MAKIISLDDLQDGRIWFEVSGSRFQVAVTEMDDLEWGHFDFSNELEMTELSLFVFYGYREQPGSREL